MHMIAIEGVIGVGKTTLARYLSEALTARLVLEEFEENPFLSAFYQDRDRYAFQTQMFFLLSRYQQMRELDKLPRPLVSDYMFQKDHLFASLTVRGDEMRMYEQIYSALLENTTPPDLIIYLRADTDTLMQRIKFRDRPYERNMDETYIDLLRIAYEKFFAHYDSHYVLRIDTQELDIVQNEEHRWEVIQRILSRLGEAPQQPVLFGDEPLSLLDKPHLLETPDSFSPPIPLPTNGNGKAWLDPFMQLQENLGDFSRQLRHDDHTHPDILTPLWVDMLRTVLTLGKKSGIDLQPHQLIQLAQLD